MKRFLISSLVILLSGVTFAQTKAELYDKFSRSVSQRDSTAVAALISDWERLYPDDAELYSVRANYYFMNAIREVVVMSAEEPSDGRTALSFKDSLGVTRYMYSEPQYDAVKIGLAESALEEGIAKHPDRLDLRLGKVTIHLRANENTLAVQEIESALERSITNKNKWVGTLDAPIETDGVSYLRDCVQDYFAGFLDTDDMASAKRVIDAAVRLYPKDAVFLADRAAIGYFSGDLKDALKWYLSALENAPDDMLVANNIAHIYDELGDKQNAIKYYRIVANSGDEDFAESAKAELKRLSAM